MVNNVHIVVSGKVLMSSLESLLVGTSVISYCLASVSSVVGLVSKRRFNEKKIALLLGIGSLPLVAVLIAHGVRAGRLPAFGRFEALTTYCLAVTAFYILTVMRHHMRAVSAILVPYTTALLIYGAVALDRRVDVPLEIDTIWLGLHVITAFIGYALCTLAGMLALAYMIQDNNLKRKRFGLVFERLPALETLDYLMSREIGAAFFMLTLSLAFGVHLVRLSGGGSEWAGDPKVMATIVTWGIYAVLMHMRTGAARHGKGMALVTIIGLFFVLFSFLGVHVIAESVHSFLLIGVANH